MDSVKAIMLAFMYGLWDSIKGMYLVFLIDDEMSRKNIEKQMTITSRRRPSPVPSSASAMFEEKMHRERSAMRRENSEERSLESLRKKQSASQPKTPFRERKIAKQVFRCCALNGGFTWMSIILFEQILLPTLQFILTLFYGENSQDLHWFWGWLQSSLDMVFGMMWMLPIFILSKIVSSIWFADIANEAYKVRRGRPSLIPNISKLAADFLFNLLVQALFLGQSILINRIPLPYVNTVLCFMHLCLLYALYSFEYKWFNMGWELHRRLSYIEINWPYFMGFGLPLTLLTNLSKSVIVSSCIFSIFFPLFILSGNEAKPIVGTTNTPLRLFSPTIFLSNFIFGGRKANKSAPQRQDINEQHRPKKESWTHRCSSTGSTNRYLQPPERISPARLTPEQRYDSDFIRSQMRYNVDSRTLIPTRIHDAPRAPVSSASHRS